MHFFNRETYRAARSPSSAESIENTLRILAIARQDELFTNYANLMESGLLATGSGPSLTTRLLQADQILIEGERHSPAEFIDSRALRYAFDSKRYPMYFGKSTLEVQLLPNRLRQTSLTDHIEAEILAVHRHEKGARQIGVGPNDLRVITQTIAPLAQAVIERGSSGITQSLFEARLPSPAQISAAARLVSGAYISRYLHDLGADIPTGVPGLGAFDHLAQDRWSAYLPLLALILEIIGFVGTLDSRLSTADTQIAALRGGADQIQVARLVSLLCRALAGVFATADPAAHRAPLQRLLRGSPVTGMKVLESSDALYALAGHNLRGLTNALQGQDPRFHHQYEVQMRLDNEATILVVTATKVETQAWNALAAELHGLFPIPITRPKYVAADLGLLNKKRVIHVQCEPGSVGAANSQAVIRDAIIDFTPVAIVMVGIAFGADSSKQQLGDVLVAKTLVEYEKAKVMGTERLMRGQRIESSPKLLSVFRMAEATSTDGLRVKFGVMLSGEKLVDSAPFMAELLGEEPEAIGGEMEGAGLVAAAARERVDWILIKAIVDWGANKEANNTEDHQRAIAAKACRFVLDAISRVGL